MGNDKTENIVPEHIWRATQHYHDMLEIKKYWEAVGAVTPKPFHDELERVHDRLIEAMEDENNQGGVYHAHRQMKQKDKASHEARHRPQHPRPAQNRAPTAQGEPRGSGELGLGDKLSQTPTDAGSGVLVTSERERDDHQSRLTRPSQVRRA